MSRRLAKTAWGSLWACALLAALCAPLGATDDDDDDEKGIFGYLEEVILIDAGFELPAKLDTGADTSSLDATKIKRFRRSDVSWVRFSVENPENGDLVTLERHLVRLVRIKRHDGEHQRRPVVEVEICLGGETRKVEVSLIDRSHFDYPILLGRSALQGLAVVDSDLSFTTDPTCELEADD